MKNWNADKREELADEFERIRDEMVTLLEQARELSRMELPTNHSNYDAYVFAQIAEHLDNANPHNQSLTTMAEELRGDGDHDPEPLEEFGESEDDE